VPRHRYTRALGWLRHVRRRTADTPFAEYLGRGAGLLNLSRIYPRRCVDIAITVTSGCACMRRVADHPAGRPACPGTRPGDTQSRASPRWRSAARHCGAGQAHTRGGAGNRWRLIDPGLLRHRVPLLNERCAHLLLRSRGIPHALIEIDLLSFQIMIVCVLRQAR
jgi:hypothetical protein